MFRKLFSLLGGRSGVSSSVRRSGSGHHKRAISDGFRRGSSHSAKVMADWRWKKRK